MLSFSLNPKQPERNRNESLVLAPRFLVSLSSNRAPGCVGAGGLWLHVFASLTASQVTAPVGPLRPRTRLHSTRAESRR